MYAVSRSDYVEEDRVDLTVHDRTEVRDEGGELL